MSNLPNPNASRCPAIVLAVLCLSLISCGEEQAPPQPANPDSSVRTPGAGKAAANPTEVFPSGIPDTSVPNLQARLPSPAARRQLRNAVIEEIGAQIIWCTPEAAPNDAAARDLAASVLCHLGVLSDAGEDTMVWGALTTSQTIRPDSLRGMMLDPAVFAGCYLSCFVFSGTPTLEEAGEAIVLSIPASFRSALPAGDYPHPFWHSAEEWSSYVRTAAVEFVFVDERLVGAFRRESESKPPHPVPEAWNGLWQWKDGVYTLPRTADTMYILSQDNPHALALDRAYSALAPTFNAHNCLACHTPDNPAGADQYLVLALPAQALAARASLAAILIGELDGPDPATRCNVSSLLRLPNASDITDAALVFLEEGDAATEYEWIRLIRRNEEAERISP